MLSSDRMGTAFSVTRCILHLILVDTPIKQQEVNSTANWNILHVTLKPSLHIISYNLGQNWQMQTIQAITTSNPLKLSLPSFLNCAPDSRFQLITEVRNFSKSLLPKFIVTLVVLTYRIEQSYPTVLTWWDRTSSLLVHEVFEPEISILIRSSKIGEQLLRRIALKTSRFRPRKYALSYLTITLTGKSGLSCRLTNIWCVVATTHQVGSNGPCRFRSRTFTGCVSIARG